MGKDGSCRLTSSDKICTSGYLTLPALLLWTKGPLPAPINFQNSFHIKQPFNLPCPEISKRIKFRERSHSHTFLGFVSAFPARVEISLLLFLPSPETLDSVENNVIQFLLIHQSSFGMIGHIKGKRQILALVSFYYYYKNNKSVYESLLYLKANYSSLISFWSHIQRGIGTTGTIWLGIPLGIFGGGGRLYIH